MSIHVDDHLNNVTKHLIIKIVSQTRNQISKKQMSLLYNKRI